MADGSNGLFHYHGTYGDLPPVSRDTWTVHVSLRPYETGLFPLGPFARSTSPPIITKERGIHQGSNGAESTVMLRRYTISRGVLIPDRRGKAENPGKEQ